MSARNRVFIILGLLTVGSLIWYHDHAPQRRFATDRNCGRKPSHRQLQDSGRIQTLTVEEGQDVTQGQLIATIESQDLDAAMSGC